MNIRKKKLGAFKDELIALYRKHGVSISHEEKLWRKRAGRERRRQKLNRIRR